MTTNPEETKELLQWAIDDFLDRIDDPGVFRADIQGLYEVSRKMTDAAMKELLPALRKDDE